MPPQPRQQLGTVYPHINPVAIDLVERMLTLDPTRRITGTPLILLSMEIISSLSGPHQPCKVPFFYISGVANDQRAKLL